MAAIIPAIVPPFHIFKVAEDGLRDLIEIVPTLHVANERVRQLAELWPGEYVILDQQPPESGRAPKRLAAGMLFCFRRGCSRVTEFTVSRHR